MTSAYKHNSDLICMLETLPFLSKLACDAAICLLIVPIEKLGQALAKGKPDQELNLTFGTRNNVSFHGLYTNLGLSPGPISPIAPQF